MFERPHHRRIATLLHALNSDVLQEAQCFFGGGTAIVLLLGEYRESVDVDFLCSSQDGYRLLRNTVTRHDLGGLLREPVLYVREVRADFYGIRTFMEIGGRSLCTSTPTNWLPVACTASPEIGCVAVPCAGTLTTKDAWRTTPRAPVVTARFTVARAGASSGLRSTSRSPVAGAAGSTAVTRRAARPVEAAKKRSVLAPAGVELALRPRGGRRDDGVIARRVGQRGAGHAAHRARRGRLQGGGGRVEADQRTVGHGGAAAVDHARRERDAPQAVGARYGAAGPQRDGARRPRAHPDQGRRADDTPRRPVRLRGHAQPIEAGLRAGGDLHRQTQAAGRLCEQVGRRCRGRARQAAPTTGGEGHHVAEPVRGAAHRTHMQRQHHAVARARRRPGQREGEGAAGRPGTIVLEARALRGAASIDFSRAAIGGCDGWTGCHGPRRG